MSNWKSRTGIAEALKTAGWTAAGPEPLRALRHPTGATWAVLNDSGDCGLVTPCGGAADFPSDVPDLVIVAACLAATGQLRPAPAVAGVPDDGEPALHDAVGRTIRAGDTVGGTTSGRYQATIVGPIRKAGKGQVKVLVTEGGGGYRPRPGAGDEVWISTSRVFLIAPRT